MKIQTSMEENAVDMDTLGYFIYMDKMEKQQKEQQNNPFGESDSDEEDDDP